MKNPFLLPLLFSIFIINYLPAQDGDLDPTFGSGGKRTLAFGTANEEIAALALQPDGKIVAAGSLHENNTNKTVFGVLRYLPNGTLDNSFSNDGIQTADFGSNYNNCYALALQPDGKIIAGGYSVNDQNNGDFALARYLSSPTMGVIDFSVLNNAVFIYPNPVTTGATLQYTLEKQTDITIQLFDIQGNIINTLKRAEKQEAGEHLVDLKFPETLPAGNYVLVLSDESGRVSIKIVK